MLPCILHNDIVAYMIRVAPWRTLNALRRSCRAASNIPRNEFIENHLSNVSVETASNTWVGMILPNGLRHGMSVERSRFGNVEIEYDCGVITWERLSLTRLTG